jgi:PKD repeat protein
VFTPRQHRVRVGVTALVSVVGLLMIAATLAIPGAPPTSSGRGAGAPAGSPTSSVASPATHPASPAVPTASPAAAVTLSAPGQVPTGISLSWNDATSGTFYNYTLEEASAGSDWRLSEVQVLPSASTTSTVVSGLAPSTDYDWQLTENYETCTLLLICTDQSATSNLLNLSQPSVAFLNDTKVTSTSATLEWTNNATYGGLLDFWGYELYEVEGHNAPELAQSLGTVDQQNFSVSLTPGASYSFFLNTSDCSSGCGGSSPTLLGSESNVVTLGALESLTVSLFATRSTIDLGQTDLFTCSAIGGKSPYTYGWNFSGGSTFATGTESESARLTVTSTNTVACQVTDSEPAMAPALTHVLVNPPLSVVASVNRTTADAGQDVQYYCSVSNGTAPYSLNWTLGNGASFLTVTGNRSDPETQYGAAGEYAPTCTVSDAAGAEVSPAFSLIVSPVLYASVTASSEAAAPLTSLNFTAQGELGSGTYTSYRWTFSGTSASATGVKADHAFATPGTDVAQVTVVDSNGASAVGTVNVVVSNIVIVLTTDPTSVSTGSSVAFRATASGGAGGSYNFTWSFGDGAFAYGANATHVFPVAGNDTPVLTVRDRLGASAQATLPTVAISVPSGPTPWFSAALVLLLALVAGLILAVIVFARRRSEEARALASASSAYVPPTDPKRTIQGTKVCEFCGAPNLPLRATCSHCGKPLPRRPGT